MKYAIILALLATPVSAADYCFVQPYTVLPAQGYYSQPHYNTDTVDVITRQIKLYPANDTGYKDEAGEKAFKLQWDRLLDTMPLTPRKQVAPPRKFQFADNSLPYTPPNRSANRQQSSTQTQTVTQVYNAVIRQNVVVQNGTVLLDVPPDVINQLTR